jgi:hypothetical protein
MTTRSQSKIVCQCGHEGALHCKENDAPFTKGYEEYHLSGFNGDTAYFEGFCKDTTALLVDLKPECPKCGAIGKVRYAPR